VWTRPGGHRAAVSRLRKRGFERGSDFHNASMR
jgi:hypothetical protein